MGLRISTVQILQSIQATHLKSRKSLKKLRYS